MKPFRSLLFVPGQKPDWVDKALAVGPDALILDLEDAVPATEKDRARETVARSIADIRAADSEVGVIVRANGWQTGLAGFDLDAVVAPGLDALLLAKVRNAEDVLRMDALMDHAERRAGMRSGAVAFLVTLETATALASCEEIANCSRRIAGLLASSAKDGDVPAQVGYEWTPEGTESLYLRSRVVLAARAAGIDYPVCGLWQDVGDLDGLRRFSDDNRILGFRGQIVIHPSHVGPVNEVFTPDPGTLRRYRDLIKAFEAAELDGDAATMFEGEHVDAAHANRAREAVAFATRLGVS